MGKSKDADARRWLHIVDPEPVQLEEDDIEYDDEIMESAVELGDVIWEMKGTKKLVIYAPDPITGEANYIEMQLPYDTEYLDKVPSMAESFGMFIYSFISFATGMTLHIWRDGKEYVYGFRSDGKRYMTIPPDDLRMEYEYYITDTGEYEYIGNPDGLIYDELKFGNSRRKK